MAKLVKDVWHKQKLSTACGSLVWLSAEWEQKLESAVGRMSREKAVKGKIR